MPDKANSRSPDDSQDSEPVSEGSMSASSSSANSHHLNRLSTLNQITGNTVLSTQINSDQEGRSAPTAVSEQGAISRANLPATISTGSVTEAQPPTDEPDCLLDLIVDRIAGNPVPPSDSYQRRTTTAQNSSLPSDNPPSYSDLNQSVVNSTIDSDISHSEQADLPQYSSALINAKGKHKSQELNNSSGTQFTDASDDPSTSSTPNHNGTLSEGNQPALRISLNLIRASKRLLDFLALVNSRPELYSEPLVSRAIYR